LINETWSDQTDMSTEEDSPPDWSNEQSTIIYTQSRSSSRNRTSIQLKHYCSEET
jgi:hypothetical protein